MSNNEIEMYCFKMLNGLKRLSKNQLDDFKEIILDDCRLFNTEENISLIENSVKKYFMLTL